jgi:hypothetical protein
MLVIAGIARDVARSVSRVRAFVEALRERLGACRVVVFESRSRDDSRARLARWASEDDAVELLGDGTDRYRENRPRGEIARFRRLATCRNVYLERLSAPDFAEATHAIVIDWDFSDYMPALESIVSALRDHPCDFDVLTGNALSFHARGRFVSYYDCLALRHGSFSLRRDPEATFRPNGCVYFDLFERSIHAVDTKYHPRAGTRLSIDAATRYHQKVLSAFGGIAIYDRSKLVQFRYDETTDDCEHVTFHRAMRRQGFDRIFIDPDMVIAKDRVIGAYAKAVGLLGRIVHAPSRSTYSLSSS